MRFVHTSECQVLAAREGALENDTARRDLRQSRMHAVQYERAVALPKQKQYVLQGKATIMESDTPDERTCDNTSLLRNMGPRRDVSLLT